MDLMSNILDVARSCGVSVATVSRVFNEKPMVSALTRQKVLDAAMRLGYSPKYTARRDRIIILMDGAHSISMGTYETRVLGAITRRLMRARMSFDIMSVKDALLIPANFMQGILAILSNPDSIATMRQVKNIPILMVNRPLACKAANHYSVFVNQRQGIALALDYLAQRGHRRIAFYQPSLNGWALRERPEGYRDAVRRLKLATDERLVHVMEREYCFEAVTNVAKAGATALIVSGEDASLPVNYVLYALGKNVPDDLSVISYENPSVSSYLTPPQTTISQNLDALGEQAVEVVLGLIGGAAGKGACRELQNQLIERQSVKSLI